MKMELFKTLLCKLHIHCKPVIEGMAFNHAAKCTHCHRWIDKAAGERVELEKQWWGRLEQKAFKLQCSPTPYDQDAPKPPDAA